MNISFKGDRGFQNLADHLDDFLGGGAAKLIQNRLVESLNERTVPLAKADAPVGQTGELRDSIYAEASEDDPMGAEYGASSEHAVFVVGGTRPHEIEPRERKALAWSGSGGETVFAKRVMHPGTEPNPFLMDALASTMGDICNDVVESIVETMDSMTEEAPPS